MHPNGPLQSGSQFTQDGTYLRYRTSTQKVESPDGTVRTFTTLHSRPRLTRVEDAFGNWMAIAYDESDYHAGSKQYLGWAISDSYGRSHAITLATKAGGVFAAVTEVSLDGSAEPYRFTYDEVHFPRACNHPAACSGCNQSNAFVPLLTKITLPDGSTYESPVSSYHTSETAVCPNWDRTLNGHLERLKLPTGGYFEWDWEQVVFPQKSGALRPRGVTTGLQGDYGTSNPFRYAAGIAERRRVKRNQVDELGSWEYERALAGITGFSDLGELKVTVTHRPPGHTTEHYFSVYPGKDMPNDPDPPDGWTEDEYGLPFTRNTEAGSSGRFLSTRVRSTTGSLVRTEYVEYERSGPTSANPRSKSQRTVYDDDGGRRADLVLSDFDGLGHYRKAVTSGTFSGENLHTTETTYNPGMSASSLPAATDPWVLGTFDFQKITESGEVVTREFDFRKDGYLERQRIRKGAGQGGDDVVRRYVELAGSPGFVRLEDWIGGANETIPSGSLSVITLPDPTYRQRHSYTCGVRTKTEWLAFSGSAGTPLSFLPLDLDIDCHSGRVTTSRDVAGLATSYEYDDLGRMTKVTPPGEALTSYTWSLNGSNSLPARVTIERKSAGTILTEAQVRFDDFGRVALERRKMPDGSWAERTTAWSAPGYVDRRSEWQAGGDSDNSVTTFGLYDPFGRPGRVTLPDGRQIDIDYKGEGSRTVKIPVVTGFGGSGNPLFTTASTKETYDRFGRLVFVDEPNGIRTKYEYDALDDLVEVRMNQTGSPTQVRTFDYDHRGFLLLENHPELDTGITYSKYDPFGNPGRIQRGGWDLGYTYDIAGRLVEIRDFGTTGDTSLWKKWAYAEDSGTAGSGGKGKLARTVRYNRPKYPGTTTYLSIPVSEDYTYAGIGGRISNVQTIVGVGTQGFDQPTFDYPLTYDSLGNVASRVYPECDHAYCDFAANNPFRTITSSYAQGALKEIPGYAMSIDYHPNGLVSEVEHANGVIDHLTKDLDDMARPRHLYTTGATEDFDTGLFGYDGAGNVMQMGESRFTYDVSSRISTATVPVVSDGCTDDIDLQNLTYSGTVVQETCGKITAGTGVRVTSSGDVTLRAGERIVLRDGFQVDAGGTLVAEIDPSIEPTNPAQEATWSGAYDIFGNLVSITTQEPGQSSVTRTPTASPATNRLNQVGTTYDLSGNVTGRAGWVYDYDAFNMLRGAESTGGERYVFLYGPGDERIWTIDWTNGAADTSWVSHWTLRDLEGSPLRQWRLDGANNATSHWHWEADHIWRGGGLLASVTPQGTHHFHLDHLGTPRIVTDANGTTLEYHAYYPFGEEVTNVTNPIVPLQYTGHERDDLDKGADTLGDLDYMHARYFSAHVGRFMSPDPEVLREPLAVPQRWNRYAYVRNNPMRYLDPDGLNERTGWEAGTVVNRSNQTIFIAGDVEGKTVVIPLDPGESSEAYLQDADAIVVGSGQNIDGAHSGAFKLGSSDTVVTGMDAYMLRIERDAEYFLNYAAGRAGHQSREEATQNGWTESQDMGEAREKKEELRKKRERQREEEVARPDDEPEPE